VAEKQCGDGGKKGNSDKLTLQNGDVYRRGNGKEFGPERGWKKGKMRPGSGESGGETPTWDKTKRKKKRGDLLNKNNHNVKDKREKERSEDGG